MVWGNKKITWERNAPSGSTLPKWIDYRTQRYQGSREYAQRSAAADAWAVAKAIKRLPLNTSEHKVAQVIDEALDKDNSEPSELYGLKDLAGCRGLNAEQISESFIAASKNQIKTTKEGKAITEAGLGEQLANVIKYTARNAAGPIVMDIEDANEDT